ncbi:hypothetical protein [Streptomyces sp. NPDC058045]|uniref:hypothetical protein n=1 Tax=Streptomyces sp. NPDC058045 TaxID=3346311 RepID=UPI0036E866EF
MAHAAPAPRTRRPHTAGGTRPGPAAVLLPFLIGVSYGFWTAAVERDAHAITTANWVLGLVSGIALAVLLFALHLVSPRLHSGPRALAWASLAGIAMGWIHSLSNTSLLWNVLLSLIVAFGVYVAVYYHSYMTTADADEAATARPALAAAARDRERAREAVAGREAAPRLENRP